jgi:hypothetical protein
MPAMSIAAMAMGRLCQPRQEASSTHSGWCLLLNFESIKVGDLRYRVIIANSVNEPSTTGTGTVQTYSTQSTVYANIEPIGTTTYLNSVNTEYSVTHRITIRHDPTLGIFWFILHDTILPDQTVRRDTYQVRRQQSWQGRHRFLLIDAQILKSEILP